MGPKKDKQNVKSKDKPVKCKFFDRGYCKHGEDCLKTHPDKVCEDTNCLNQNCDNRHPNPCKFGNMCLFRRKNMCLFSHVTTVPDDENVKALDKKFNKMFEVLENQNKEMKANMEKIIQKNLQSLIHR